MNYSDGRLQEVWSRACRTPSPGEPAELGRGSPPFLAHKPPRLLPARLTSCSPMFPSPAAASPCANVGHCARRGCKHRRAEGKKGKKNFSWCALSVHEQAGLMDTQGEMGACVHNQVKAIELEVSFEKGKHAFNAEEMVWRRSFRVLEQQFCNTLFLILPYKI